MKHWRTIKKSIMVSYLSLNERSRQLIKNIWVNANNHPMYAGYLVEKDEASYFTAGAIAIKVSKGGKPMNMFLFYPACDNSGKIGSVAIYGCQLEGHKKAIERSMLMFGLPVESVEMDSGIEDFVDVTLRDYNDC